MRNPCLSICCIVVALAGTAAAQTNWVLDCPMLTGAAYQDTFGRYNPDILNVSPNARYVVGYSVVSSLPVTFNLSRDAWLFHDGVTTRLRGLTGTTYEPGGANGQRYHTVRRVNNLGHAIGSSQRRTNAATLGDDAWFYNGSDCTFIGMTGGAFSPANGSRYSAASDLNSADQAIGASRQYTSNAGVYTDTAWFYQNGVTTLLGLSGATYTSGDGFRAAVAVHLNEEGRVIGTSDTFSGGPSRDWWVFQNGVTTQLNPMAAEFRGADGRREATVDIKDNPQLIVGTASIYQAGTNTATGRKAWVFANGVVNVIAPPNPGAGGVVATPQFAKADAVVVFHGWYNTPGIQGSEVWVHRNGFATRTGLVNPVGPRFSEAKAMNASGAVVGYSNRYTAGQVTGTQAWLFTPDTSNGGTTISIHPTAAQYVFPQQSSFPIAITPGGDAVIRVQVNGTNSREVLVYRNGQHSVIDASATPGHTASNGYHFSDVGASSINSHGQVLGTSARLNPDGSQLGTTPWLWDPQTGMTTIVPIPTAPNGQSQWSGRLGEDGSVSGKYAAYEEGLFTRYRSYVWSQELGFIDLENAVGAVSLADNGVNYLDNPASSDVYPAPAQDLACGNATSVRSGDFRVYVVHPFVCGAADLGKQGGLAGSDGRLDNNDFIVFINLFFAGNTGADFGVQGGQAGHDGQLDNNDFIAFINAFFSGCG